MSLPAIDVAFSKSEGLDLNERLVYLAYAYMADEAGVIKGTFGCKCHVSRERIFSRQIQDMTGLPGEMVRFAQTSLEGKDLLRRHERNYLLNMGI
jgi:hypothetical protein